MQSAAIRIAPSLNPVAPRATVADGFSNILDCLGWLVEGLLWGTAGAVLPFEVVVHFCWSWIVREWCSLARRGTLPSAVRASVVLITLGVAIMAPVKYDDQRIGPVKYVDVPLNEVCRSLSYEHHFGIVARSHNFDEECQRVTFMTSRPLPPHELAWALADTVGWDARRYRGCAVGNNLLWGGTYDYLVCPKQPQIAAADELAAD